MEQECAQGTMCTWDLVPPDSPIFALTLDKRGVARVDYTLRQ